MLHVTLSGKLGASLDALATRALRTPVEWHADGEARRAADLVLQLPDESHVDASAGPVVVVTKSPADGDTDQVLQAALRTAYGFVVGYSDSMHAVCKWIRALAHPMAEGLNMRGLIVGETGVGKELVARAIHQLSRRSSEPFVAMNCASLPGELATSEIFGHVRGAFTGAVSHRRGAAETAGRGTLFLDEIGDMAALVQPLLLRMLEARSFQAVGSDQAQRFSAQVLAATNRSIADAVGGGHFRADLYFRLAQVTISVPPLRERADDIPLLVEDFAGARRVPTRVVDALRRVEWPGNVRQLKSAVERLLLLSEVTLDWDAAVADVVGKEPRDERGKTLAELHDDFERTVLTKVLARCGGDTTRIAEELGVTRRTVYNLLQRHRLGGAEG